MSILNWVTTHQAQRLPRRVYRARGSLSKTSGMIGVRVRQNNCRRRNFIQLAKPIPAAIKHDPSIFVLDKQRTVALMPTRANLDFAPRTKKR